MKWTCRECPEGWPVEGECATAVEMVRDLNRHRVEEHGQPPGDVTYYEPETGGVWLIRLFPVEGRSWIEVVPDPFGEEAAARESTGGDAQARAEADRMAAALVAPNVRTSDPGTSHQAAALYEPSRESYAWRVLDYLRARPGVWVDGAVLEQEQVGGRSATRRYRELRTAGWPLDEPRPSGSSWQYRYVEPAVPGSAG